MIHKSVGCTLVAMSAIWGWNTPVIASDDLFIYSAGLESVFADPRDRGLRDALRLLDERIAELPAELGKNDIPAPAIPLLLNLLMEPMTFRAGMLQSDDARAIPLWAQMSFHTADKAAANEIAGRAGAMLAQVGRMQPVTGKPGMQMLDLDGVPLYLGVADDGTSPSFVLALNEPATATTIDLRGFELPSGVQPAMAVRADFKLMRAVMEMSMQGMPPDMRDQVSAQFKVMGLINDPSTVLTAAWGHGLDRAYLAARMTNYAAVAQRWGVPANDPITVSDLKLIPADASMAQVSKFHIGTYVDAMIDMFRYMPQAGMPEDMDPMAMIEQETGIHPKRDVLDKLGSTIGFYTSDSTGGGMFGSVVFVKVSEGEALQQSLSRIAGMVNEFARQNARGYVRIASRRHAGHDMMVLTFPGIPIPLELSCGQASGYLIAAASPGALTTALEQAKSGKNSLADQPQFREAGGTKLDGAVKLTYLDSPRAVKSGYGLVSMGMAALSNMTRSPHDESRGVLMVMPGYHELVQGAVPSLSITRMMGEDIIIEGQLDRSMLVNACGAAGSLGGAMGIAAIAGLFGGISMPAMARARESATDVKNIQMLRQVSMAMIVYGNDNNDRLPRDIRELVEMGYIDESMLRSPWGPAPDGGADLWIDTSGAKLSAIMLPNERIIAYDRTMLFMRGQTNVAFMDGHVQVLTDAELREMSSRPANEGVNLQLPR